jgi:putative heme degradation protein
MSAESKATAAFSATPTAEPAHIPARIIEARKAQEAASTTIDAAVLRHEWSQDDAYSFRAMLGAMDPADRELAIHKLTTAINAGQLRIMVVGAPF